ncbi:SH3 domain-containing protein [Streptomyces tropicalis]|uniref:SH3 domain-containing protein n=1 Tax=Streptomyces tropicalis TaxID=3034234 RepID=A0ABT6AEC0_9ACTN|nr:SH3 domain-containing protein [Streptomyces tropicalis]MDF3303000.1 SH3 domain-containing protein [Streptomyces tropicalis]
MSVERVEEAGRTAAAGTAAVTGAPAGSVAAVALVRYYPVAPGVRVNVRSGPGTGYGVVRVLPEGASVPIHCQTTGTTVTGPYGTSALWDCVGSGEYVADAYVHTGSDGYVASRCG